MGGNQNIAHYLPDKMRDFCSISLALFLLLNLGFTLGGRSPHADLIESYYMNDGPEAGIYSDNLLEDALLDVPGLITKYGYPVEEHEVVTEDGYVLTVHRIPHGRDSNNVRDPNKPVVFVQHGLLSSSADWVLMGPGAGLGYILAEAGYDVWLGNARGTTYSRKHIRLDPDNSRQDFWRFSWDEIGNYDLPAMIDRALSTTGKQRLHYIGHSQGTTAFWVMASLRPEYNNKIIGMQAFAPVAFFTHTRNPFFLTLGPQANRIEFVASLIGINELLPNHPIFGQLGRIFCSDGAPTQPVCSNMLFLIAGRSEDMHNATLLPVKLAHTPAGAAVRQIVHYGQHMANNFFRRYDHGPLGNWLAYRTRQAPDYPLNRITAPVYFHYVDNDIFADLEDVDILWRSLGSPIARMRIAHPTFSHLDFMWGTGANEYLYQRTINIMNSLGTN